MAMETIAEALRRLDGAGYTDEFRADPKGLRSRATGSVRPPEEFRVDEIVRFEGESDPSEESAVVALTPNDAGPRGTFTVAFGPLMDPQDADLFRRLGPAA